LQGQEPSGKTEPLVLAKAEQFLAQADPFQTNLALQLQAVSFALVPLELARPVQLMTDETQVEPFHLKVVLQKQASVPLRVPLELLILLQLRVQAVPFH